MEGVREQIKKTPVSFGCGVILTVFFLAGRLGSTANSYLAMSPSTVFMEGFHVWNIVTTGFYERSIILYILSMAGVMKVGREVELLFTPEEMLRLVLVVNAIIGLTTFFVMVVLYVLFRYEYFLFVQVSGFVGMLSAWSVALARQYPTRTLPIAPALPLKYVPFMIMSVATVLWAYFFNTAPTSLSSGLLLAIIGVVAGWTHLRFFHRYRVARNRASGGAGARESAVVVGDHRDEFGFAQLFPPPISGFLSGPSQLAYGVVRACGALGAWDKTYMTTKAGEQRTATAPRAVRSDPVAERRRARAMEALDKQLMTMAATPELPLDEDAEEEAQGGGADNV